MNDDSSAPVLRRMLRPAVPGATGPEMSEARAWGVSIPRASEEAIGLMASLTGFEASLTDFETILSDWEEFVLVLALNGPAGARGLAMLDAELRAALIEVQTTGRVGRATPAPRSATETDAALTGHVLDAWISAFEEAAGEVSGCWRAGRLVPTVRAGKLAIDEGEFRARDLFLSLGDGARKGRMRLVVPFEGGGPGVGAPAPYARRSVLGVEAELHAILHRTTVPVGWLRNLAPGACLEIPAEAVTRLRVEDSEGRFLTHARLGRSRGRMAIRICSAGEVLPPVAPVATPPPKPPAQVEDQDEMLTPATLTEADALAMEAVLEETLSDAPGEG